MLKCFDQLSYFDSWSINNIGLCPSINFTNLGHNILDWVGMIPVLGEGADLINAYWYFKEGNTAYGASSILCAMPGMGTLIGSSTKIMKKVLTLGKILSKSCLMVGNGVYMAEAGIVGSQMIDSYLIKGENINASEFAVQSMSIVGGLIAGVGISKQVKELRKSKIGSKVGSEAKRFWNDNKGMLDLRRSSKSGKNTNHGNQRLKERGFTQEKADDIVNNYSQKVYQDGGRTVYAKKTGIIMM